MACGEYRILCCICEHVVTECYLFCCWLSWADDGNMLLSNTEQEAITTMDKHSDLLEDLKEYAYDIANWRVDHIESRMEKHRMIILTLRQRRKPWMKRKSA